jgi:hypothetical protein
MNRGGVEKNPEPSRLLPSHITCLLCGHELPSTRVRVMDVGRSWVGYVCGWHTMTEILMRGKDRFTVDLIWST